MRLHVKRAARQQKEVEKKEKNDSAVCVNVRQGKRKKERENSERARELGKGETTSSANAVQEGKKKVEFFFSREKKFAKDIRGEEERGSKREVNRKREQIVE